MDSEKHDTLSKTVTPPYYCSASMSECSSDNQSLNGC